MFDINQWPMSTWGSSLTRWAGNQGGIPGATPVWEIGLGEGPSGLFTGLSMTSDVVYANALAEGCFAYNAETGKQLWLSHPFIPQGAHELSINGDWLAAGFLILDRNTGEVKEDFRTLLEKEGIAHSRPLNKYVRNLPYQAGFIRFAGTLDNYNACYFDAEGEVDCFAPGVWPSVIEHGTSFIFGHIGKDRVGCYDLKKRNMVWARTLPKLQQHEWAMEAVALYQEKLYIPVMYASLQCLDARTGDLCWEYSEPEKFLIQGDAYYGGRPTRFGLCGDRIYLGRSRASTGWLQAHDIHTGEPLWKIEVEEGMEFCICGDLIFGVEDSWPVAWDRYDGRKVWQADEALVSAYFVMSGGNRVVYSSTLGEIRCFQWEENYISPARPSQV